ncbi:MAG: hypothetical protein R2719_03610 [Micropruina sp.]
MTYQVSDTSVGSAAIRASRCGTACSPHCPDWRSWPPRSTWSPAP